MSRIRTNLITNRMANGAPTVSNGLVISGVTTSTNVSVASSVTATSFYGSGANLTGLSGVSVVNQSNNRLITATGTTDALNGEAQLTFDGNKLITQQTNSDIGLLVQNTTHDSQLRIEAVAANKNSVIMFADGSDGDVGMIDYDHNDNSMSFTTNTNERLRIQSNGRVNIGVNPQVGAQSLLNLKGSGDDGNQTVLLRLGNDSSGSGTGAAIVMGAGAGASSQGATIAGFYDGTGTAFTVGTNASFNGSTTERLRIKSDGVLLLPTTGKLSVGPTNPTGRFSVGPANGSRVIEIEEYGVIRGYNRNSSAWAQIDFEASSYSFDCGGTERLNINSNGQVTQPAQPSFAAYRNQDGYSLNNEVFPFNVTRHNTGSHFNTGNHRFTAPVAGRYIFTFYSILNSQINSGVYSFRVNNSTSYGHNVHFTTVNTHWDHVSTSQIMNLNANDYVTMWSNSNVNWHGNGWQIFCGELLS